jgi:hypothetical protein
MQLSESAAIERLEGKLRDLVDELVHLDRDFNLKVEFSLNTYGEPPHGITRLRVIRELK